MTGQPVSERPLVTDRIDSGVTCERSVLATPDGHAIRVDSWRHRHTSPRAILQILHGLSEHAARYERFAQRSAAAGYVVVAHNHRGHGENCAAEDLGHFADRNGWNKVIDDAKRVQIAACHRHPSLPLALFGHSMGSYIAQCMAMRYPDDVAALVLSGSTWPSRAHVVPALVLAWLEKKRHGTRYRSSLLDDLAFRAFNRRFAPTRTPFDWLSRDTAEVDLYRTDPLCGVVPSAGLWLDLLGGLLETGRPKAIGAVPADLPILITGGEADAAGGRKGMAQLAAAYERRRHTAVSLVTYPHARHEMLNETNRVEFMNDVLAWLDSALANR